MKNEIMLFENELFGDIRLLEREDGSVYYLGTDIANALGYKDPQQAIRKNCKDIRNGIIQAPISTGRGNRNAKFISEANVYRLITRSNLDAAQEFEIWLFEEVLPTLRKTGAYVTDAKMQEIESGTITADEVFKEVQEYKTKLRDMRKKLRETEINSKQQQFVIDLYSNMLAVYGMDEMAEKLNEELDTCVLDRNIIRHSLVYTGYIMLKENGKYILSEMAKKGNFAEVREATLDDGTVVKGAFFNEAVKNHIRDFIRGIIEEADRLSLSDPHAPKFMQLFYNEICKGGMVD